MTDRVRMICHEFSQAWAAGQQPRIEDYLDKTPEADRSSLLRALLAIEIKTLGSGPSTLAEYEGRFPHKIELVQSVFNKHRLETTETGSYRPEPALSETVAMKLAAREHEIGSPCRVVLEVIAGPHKGVNFDFSRHDTFVAGRADAAQLCLAEDPYFSRYHFRLEVNPPECYFLDLGSRNGTFINDERVMEQFLQDGDVISGGKTKMRFSIIAAPNRNSRGISSVTDTKKKLPHDLRPVPGYDVISEIGSGAMGVVYRAVQKSTRKQVALKVIVPANGATEEALKLFIREASILGQLDHPRIVRFYECGMAAGQLFISMEYVKTIDFPSMLERLSAASRVRVPCAIACQVLDALSYTHARSLVHRDVKPENILLSRPDRKLSVKLADFGLAKNYANAGFSEITRDGETRGTINYMPPEQLVDCRHAKPTCDVYSVGATLYRYLCGKSIYNVSTSGSAIRAILEGETIPLDRRLPDLPAELVAIVHRALAKDPLERFASADKMRLRLLPFAKRDRK